MCMIRDGFILYRIKHGRLAVLSGLKTLLRDMFSPTSHLLHFRSNRKCITRKMNTDRSPSVCALALSNAFFLEGEGGGGLRRGVREASWRRHGVSPVSRKVPRSSLDLWTVPDQAWTCQASALCSGGGPIPTRSGMVR